MGRFFNIVAPFSTKYEKQIYVFDDNSVSAWDFALMLGFYSSIDLCKEHKELENFIKDRKSQLNPRTDNFFYRFIDIDDMPAIMKILGRDPEDLKKVFGVKAENKKREREETQPSDLSTTYMKEFARRYISEHPTEARNLIISNVVAKKAREIIEKLNG